MEMFVTDDILLAAGNTDVGGGLRAPSQVQGFVPGAIRHWLNASTILQCTLDLDPELRASLLGILSNLRRWVSVRHCHLD
jgi:hypothetical protein